jgi:hypothetical protein
MISLAKKRLLRLVVLSGDGSQTFLTGVRRYKLDSSKFLDYTMDIDGREGVVEDVVGLRTHEITLP